MELLDILIHTQLLILHIGEVSQEILIVVEKTQLQVILGLKPL